MRGTCLYLLVSVASAYCQSNFATLAGRIEDPQRRPIEYANVQVKSAATGAVRNSIAGTDGLYEFAGLAPGEYTLEVRAPGFAVQSRRLRLEVGQQMRLDLALSVEENRETVEVVGFAEALKTADASVGEVVEQQSIRELPLNGRMLLDLALTVPGSHHSHGAQTGDMHPLYWRPGQASALSIGGSRPNANYFLLDGVTNTDPTFNTQNLSVSPDAVLEFKVQTGSYSAEMGGAGGGQINLATRSGTNRFHGTAYEFVRNNVFDARNFNEMAGVNRLVQNNFGASAGGPLKGQKTFFFANYEGLRKTMNMTSVATVPTSMEAMGDFSASGVDIFNPFSSRNNPAFDPNKAASAANPRVLRDPFPDNTIPASMIRSAPGIMLDKYVPRPNSGGMTGSGMGMSMGAAPVVGSGLDANNFTDNRNQHLNNNQGSLRVDRYFGKGDNLFARYSISGENGFTPQNLPGFGALHDNMAQHLAVVWNHVVSTRAVNTASFAISRLAMNHTSENSSANDIVSELGIQGIGYGGKGAYGAPYFNVQGYTPFGDNYIATPMHAWDALYEGRDSLSWQRGRHALKFGGSYRFFVWPMWGFFQNRGYYQFTNGFTTRTASNDGTGSALASFELGLPAVRQRQAGIPSMDMRQWYADAFAQDSWRIAQNTTIEYGVRYEYMSPLHDVSKTLTNLLVENGRLTAFIGGQNGMPEGLLYTSKLRFAPRAGIAHHIPSLGMVIRGAYGIFYTPVDMNTWCNQVHNVPLVFPETNQSDNFTPSITTFDFGQPVLGRTVVSFAAFDPHAPSQYVQQWSGSVQKSLGSATVVEAGYQGARGLHLQRSHLINNALPGPGLIQPRRPYQTASFQPGTVIPADIALASTTFPVSSVNLLENTARSWYDGGYVNVRRRYASGLSLLASYTWSKNLSDAPDFRSPMFEAAIPQDNSNLAAEKGLSCDVRHRFVLSGVYDMPSVRRNGVARTLTKNWRVSTIYQAQSGFPFTAQVFGDTANAGTVLGDNPVRANYSGVPVFGPGTRTVDRWVDPAAFTVPASYTFGNVGRNTIYSPGMQTLDGAIERVFPVTEGSSVQFRAEFFNALNHTNLGTPNRFVNTPQFGTITEAQSPNRELQFSLRYSF